MKKKLLKKSAIVLAGIVFLLWTFYLAVLLGAFGEIPSKAKLSIQQNPIASEVYSADGTLLGRFFNENRTPIAYENISPWLTKALVATEDIRFYDHSGMDFRSMLRVLFKSILMQDTGSGGGSTLSQQLAKNLFPRKRFGVFTLLINKTKELIIARRLEKIHTKNELLTRYVNTVSFGENTYGIETASQRFFGIPALHLHPQQAALLVGMLKAPNSFNPRLYPLPAVQRRKWVLTQMVKAGYLNPTQADSLSNLTMSLRYQSRAPHERLAPYFKEQVRLEVRQWLSDHPKPDGTSYNLYTDGLKIHTPLDLSLQSLANQAVFNHMKDLQASFSQHWKNQENQALLQAAMQKSPRYRQLKKRGVSEEEIQTIFRKPISMEVFAYEGTRTLEMSPWDSLALYTYWLQAGMVAMEPQTGKIKAWIGGVDPLRFPYDHVRARRQTGSIFKPIVYVTALENGIKPCDYISNERPSFRTHPDWVPRNADREYGGEYSMEGGLTHSVNVVAANLIMKTGAGNVVKKAHEMGIKGDIPAVPAIALGAASASPLEMASAYSTLANRGKAIPPRFVDWIEDREGNILHLAEEGQQILQPDNADIMVSMLQSVVSDGTARSLTYKYGFKNNIAGKTGTTQDQADGWFAGITPDLVTTVWVGADNPQVHFRSLALGQGAHMALPIWANFMKAAYADPQFTDWQHTVFPTPSAEARAQMACAHTQSSLYMDAFRDFFQGINKYR